MVWRWIADAICKMKDSCTYCPLCGDVLGGTPEGCPFCKEARDKKSPTEFPPPADRERE